MLEKKNNYITTFFGSIYHNYLLLFLWYLTFYEYCVCYIEHTQCWHNIQQQLLPGLMQ